MANSSLVPASLEAQLPTSSDPLSAGGTSVTSSLTQPLVAEKLMWSPSAGPRTENQAPGEGGEGRGGRREGERRGGGKGEEGGGGEGSRKE